MIEKFDAIVIGGGPGGATAALLLARAGWSVAVVEKSSFPRRKVCGEYLSATNFPLFRQLGIFEDFLRMAGPPVRQVGLFAGETILVADMPQTRNGEYGRALSREVLDTLLLNRAAAAGAAVLQPWMVTRLQKDAGEFVCGAVQRDTRETKPFRAGIVIAAHGSWESGNLPTQSMRQTVRPSDLLAFKAHFRDSRLPRDLMPLLVFPGGYGGMAHTDNGRVSLSCCVRRDQLERWRLQTPDGSAAETVVTHIKNLCRGVRNATDHARLEGAWLSAGPIRPGIRFFSSDGIFLVGNAAGEAHPIIAEGITMAIQSAWLLCGRLGTAPRTNLPDQELDKIGREYAKAWRRAFAPRRYAASFFAYLAMRPAATGLVLRLTRCFPAILRCGARLSGKTRIPASSPCVGQAPSA